MYGTAVATAGPKPLWHVGNARMLFAGCLNRNALHSHSTTVLLAGLYDNFELRVGGVSWVSCRMAVIRAGTPYEFNAGGRPLAVLYVEPTAACVDGLTALLRNRRELPGAVIGTDGEASVIRALYEDPGSLSSIDPALADLVSFSTARTRRPIDRRVARAIEHATGVDCYEGDRGSSPAVSRAAQGAGLSLSRFQHLFKDEVGVSYHRYLAWLRMKRAVRHVVQGANLTMAAHGAGYYDQAHFAREFRRIFGAPASRSLSDVRRHA